MSPSKVFHELKLSRRERQIMDVVFRLSKASVSDIVSQLPNPPTQGAVRRMLNLMEQKQLLVSKQDGPRKIYYPADEMAQVQRSVLDRLVETFFGGSAAKAMASLVENTDMDLSENEAEVLSKLIERAEEEGR